MEIQVMITEPCWKISKKLLKRKERWDSKLNLRNVNFFPFDITEKRRSTFLASFHKLCPGIKTPKKDELINLGSPLGPKSQADSLEKKINELEEVNGIVEKLDALCGFVMLKNCFSLPKLLYVMRTSTCFNHPALSQKNDKTVRDGLSKWCNVNFDDILSTQLALPPEMGGLGVSSASIFAHSGILASAFGASDFVTTIFSETFEDVSLTKALEKWMSLTYEQESSLDGTQKNWTQPVYVKTAQDLISRMDDKRSKIFNAHQGKFASQWVNVVPCKNLGLKLDDQQLRISIALRLGANICVAHTCNCGKRVERDGLHGLSCTKSAGRFSRHATLNSLINQTLGPMLEPRGLYRTDGKRSDGVTMIPWKMGKQLVWEIYGFSYKAHKQSDIYFLRAKWGDIVTSFHLILVRKFVRKMLFCNSLKQSNARSKSKINYMLSYLNYQQKS